MRTTRSKRIAAALCSTFLTVGLPMLRVQSALAVESADPSPSSYEAPSSYQARIPYRPRLFYRPRPVQARPGYYPAPYQPPNYQPSTNSGGAAPSRAELPQELNILYRVTDQIARANGLDSNAWQVSLVPNYDPAAYASGENRIAIASGLLNQLRGDEDAIACLVGREMAHQVHNHTTATKAERQQIYLQVREKLESEVAQEMNTQYLREQGSSGGNDVIGDVIKRVFVQALGGLFGGGIGNIIATIAGSVINGGNSSSDDDWDDDSSSNDDWSDDSDDDWSDDDDWFDDDNSSDDDWSDDDDDDDDDWSDSGDDWSDDSDDDWSDDSDDDDYWTARENNQNRNQSRNSTLPSSLREQLDDVFQAMVSQLEQRWNQRSRDQEYQADEYAYIYATTAGFDPQGCVRAIDAVNQASSAQPDGALPAMPDRMATLNQLTTEHPPTQLTAQGQSKLASNTQPLSYSLGQDQQSLVINPRSGNQSANP